MAYFRSVHDSRYDRQMRLWGAAGQYELEQSHAIVIGSSTVACEIIKNLILPNIGTYTIVDDHIIDMDDVGCNYFVTEQDIGQYRCDITAQQLHELNSDTKYDTVKQSVTAYITDTLCQMKSTQLANTIVIVTQLHDISTLLQCADYCYQYNVPLLYVLSVGLLSYIRIQIRELCIVESHPAVDQYDLYIHPSQSAHFTALHIYLSSYHDIDNSTQYDSHQHAHIPYIAILHVYLQQYMKSNNNSLPITSQQRTQFKQLIESGRHGIDEVNFDEAIDNYIYAVNQPSIDTQVQQVLNDSQAENITDNSHNYWYCIRAIRDFIQYDTAGSHCLPVSTRIPDMHCTSEEYIHIKQLYAQQAQTDLNKIIQRVQSLLKHNNRSIDSIPISYIEYVVKNIRQVRVYRTNSIRHEYTQVNVDNIQEQIDEYNDAIDSSNDTDIHVSNVDWYIVIRGYIQFIDQYKRIPGLNQDECEDDYNKLCEWSKLFCTNNQLKHTIQNETVHEMYVIL